MTTTASRLLADLKAEVSEILGPASFRVWTGIHPGTPTWWQRWWANGDLATCRHCGCRLKGVRVLIDDWIGGEWGHELYRSAICLDRPACRERKDMATLRKQRAEKAEQIRLARSFEDAGAVSKRSKGG